MPASNSWASLESDLYAEIADSVSRNKGQVRPAWDILEQSSTFLESSSSGIGAATVVLFAKEGANVTITGRNEENVKKTRDVIVDAGIDEDHTLCVLADLTDAKDRKKLIDNTISKWGRLDILHIFKVCTKNHFSVLQMVQLARPYLIKSKGEVVNVSSISGLQFGIVLTPYYAISKAGLDQLTRALAIDLIQYGVRVNGVSPGLVKTSFAERTGLTKEQSDKLHDFYGSQKHSCPRGKYAEPYEIANVIAFLADRQISSFIVGQSIVVDGGMSLIMGAYAFDYKKVICPDNSKSGGFAQGRILDTAFL